tara:strand:- start:827 stop:1186 length:360 start_codon:yes stop_codon:yes gene_type:complete
MVDFKETVLASVDVNSNIAPAGDSIWARHGVEGIHPGVVPNTIFVSQVQIIERTYTDDGMKIVEGLIFHPEYEGWEVYTDSSFVNDVMKAAKLDDKFSATFSEQGMQYINACHLDVEVL